VVTCKIKHFYNIFTSTAWQREIDGSKTFLQMFYFTCKNGLIPTKHKCLLVYHRELKLTSVLVHIILANMHMYE